MDLGGLVRDTFDLLRARCEKHGVRLVAEGDEKLELVADREQLKQIFVNLMLNALDAMPGGGTLTVRVRRLGGRAKIEVSDTGPGISSAMMGRLFEPFASGKDTGLGLGLVISKRIVEDHGGSISAANRIGGGASFFVSIPLLMSATHDA
jgi:two-component system sensor histidine kinase HydH